MSKKKNKKIEKEYYYVKKECLADIGNLCYDYGFITKEEILEQIEFTPDGSILTTNLRTVYVADSDNIPITL